MRQVPRYIVIGNGRMAQHVCQYLEYLAIDYQRWFRSADTCSQLHTSLSQSTHALILISDNAIDEFILENILQQHKHIIKIHFSGCLISQYAYSAHPLQSFTKTLYSFDDYQRFPFVIDEDAPPFCELLPGFINPHYRIKKTEKPYYHALCVLANNFSSLLWDKFFKEMQERFGIQPTHLAPYLQQTFNNIATDPASALTGPIQRKDMNTLTGDLTALQDDDFYSIFKAFVNQFVLRRDNEKHS